VEVVDDVAVDADELDSLMMMSREHFEEMNVTESLKVLAAW